MCCDVRHLTVPDPNRLGPVKYDSARRCDLLTGPWGGGGNVVLPGAWSSATGSGVRINEGDEYDTIE